MHDARTPTRTAVAREYGHPWPWKVEELLRREFERHDGDIRALANAFGCHPHTVDKWVRRYGLREAEPADGEESSSGSG